MKRSIPPALSALVIAVLLSACASAAAPPPTSGSSAPSGKPQVMKAELTAPPKVPSAITRKEPAVVQVEMETVEQKGVLADGVEYTFWTFSGTVPGPMVRVRQGDTVDFTLKNRADSIALHSIDLHAVTGPGGGAVLTQTAPGGKTGFTFKALNPGVYVYHCATPVHAEHIANGMYGLILVEPEEGLPAVDREYYVMQGEFYTKGKLGEKGLQAFSMDKMMAETPEYIVFNGSTTGLAGDKALKARVGETVRLYIGVGGPNITSSFHVIGEIFDTVYPEGASQPVYNVQTTRVSAGGAAAVEMAFQVPGQYILVDHSLSRLMRGAAGFITVEGEPAPTIFGALDGAAAPTSGAGH